MAMVVRPGPVSIMPIWLRNGSSLTRYVQVEDGPLIPRASKSIRPPLTRSCIRTSSTPASIDLEQHHRLLGAADGVLADRVDQRGPALGRTRPDLRHLLAVKDCLPGVHDVAALPFD